MGHKLELLEQLGVAELCDTVAGFLLEGFQRHLLRNKTDE